MQARTFQLMFLLMSITAVMPMDGSESDASDATGFHHVPVTGNTFYEMMLHNCPAYRQVTEWTDRGVQFDRDRVLLAIKAKCPIELIRFVIDSGSPVDARTLYFALRLRASASVIDLLLRSGAPFNSRTIMAALRYHVNVEVIRLLVQWGAPIGKNAYERSLQEGYDVQTARLLRPE